MDNFVFSKHANEQMQRRHLCKEVVLSVLEQPDERVGDQDDPSMIIYQSLIKEKGQVFLVRIFVNVSVMPPRVVTLYKTSKIFKYYEGKI
jgi:hypothetical protein